jgi:hypothetical protein
LRTARLVDQGVSLPIVALMQGIPLITARKDLDRAAAIQDLMSWVLPGEEDPRKTYRRDDKALYIGEQRREYDWVLRQRAWLHLMEPATYLPLRGECAFGHCVCPRMPGVRSSPCFGRI